jgi:zeta-carotene desaturase
LAVRELAEFFPEVASAKVEKAALVKEVRATFTVPPGIDAARPTSASPWPNCVLAGDWTATGWPSTMESAARSGHLAAEAVCAALGERRRILNSDLKPRGVMRFVKTATSS